MTLPSMSHRCLCPKNAYWALGRFAFPILRRSVGGSLHPYSNEDAVSCMHPFTAVNSVVGIAGKGFALAIFKRFDTLKEGIH